jgi:hypothetical protein
VTDQGKEVSLGDGKNRKSTFPPRSRKIAAEFCQRPLDGEWEDI